MSFLSQHRAIGRIESPGGNPVRLAETYMSPLAFWSIFLAAVTFAWPAALAAQPPAPGNGTSVLSGASAPVTCLALSADGKRAVTGAWVMLPVNEGVGELKLYDA